MKPLILLALLAITRFSSSEESGKKKRSVFGENYGHLFDNKFKLGNFVDLGYQAQPFLAHQEIKVLHSYPKNPYLEPIGVPNTYSTIGDYNNLPFFEKLAPVAHQFIGNHYVPNLEKDFDFANTQHFDDFDFKKEISLAPQYREEVHHSLPVANIYPLKKDSFISTLESSIPQSDIKEKTSVIGQKSIQDDFDFDKKELLSFAPQYREEVHHSLPVANIYPLKKDTFLSTLETSIPQSDIKEKTQVIGQKDELPLDSVKVIPDNPNPAGRQIVSIGSGSLGVTKLPNGKLVLGSGSLGYTGRTSATGNRNNNQQQLSDVKDAVPNNLFTPEDFQPSPEVNFNDFQSEFNAF